MSVNFSKIACWWALSAGVSRQAARELLESAIGIGITVSGLIVV